MSKSNVMRVGKSVVPTIVGAGGLLLLSGMSQGLEAAEGTLRLSPLKSGASLYFGQMFNIEDTLMGNIKFNPTVTLPTTSLWMVQEATLNDRLNFNLGIAGTFWYPFPEETDVGWTSYRTGGVAISQANANYLVGDPARPWMQINVGLQGYKYNPYAKNFGEYLFRSEAYPTTVRTGDWGAIDNAGAGIWGVAFKGDFLGGMLKNDFLVTMANERAPLHDLSFTNITSLQLGKVFQIGGGVMFSRYLQIDPDKSHPKKKETGWFTWTNADQATLDAYLTANPGAFTRDIGLVDSVGNVVMVSDTALAVGQDYWAASQRPLVLYASDSIKGGDLQFVDTKTIFLMGRASFDPKPFFGGDAFLSPSDLVVYGEISVLGMDNYPVYYKSLSERMPMMVGLYLPTFRLLDFWTVEIEQFKNPHMNSDFIVGLSRAPRPKSPNGDLPENPSIADPYHDRGFNQLGANHTEDDFKFTMTALKSFGPWNLSIQIGKDHFRPLLGAFRPAYTEAATTSDAWYYMVRFLVNI